MRPFLSLAPVLAALLATASAGAQEQQAGNAASANAEETFRRLIAQCEDIGVLTQRAKIRLQIPRATETAGAEAQGLLDQGLAECGGGDVAKATATLDQALAVAAAGVTEKFGVDASAEAPAAEPEPEAPTAETDAAAEPEKPWWRFW